MRNHPLNIMGCFIGITTYYSNNGSLFLTYKQKTTHTSHSAEVKWFLWCWGSVVVLVVGVDVSPVTLTGPTVVGALRGDDGPLWLALCVRIGQCVLRPGLTWFCPRWYYGTFIWKKQMISKYLLKKSLLIMFHYWYPKKEICFLNTCKCSLKINIWTMFCALALFSVLSIWRKKIFFKLM